MIPGKLGRFIPLTLELQTVSCEVPCLLLPQQLQEREAGGPEADAVGVVPRAVSQVDS